MVLSGDEKGWAAEKVNAEVFLNERISKPHPHALLILSFVLIWWVCFLIYPLWYVPHEPGLRGGVAAALMIAGVAMGYLFRYLASLDGGCIEFEKDSRFWFVVLSGVFVLHIPFLPLPILTGLDMIDHASVPAVAAAKIIHPISSRLGFPIEFMTVPVVCLMALLFCTKPVRTCSGSVIRRIADVFCRHLGWVYLTLIPLTGLYVWGVMHFAVPDRFGDTETLFRYQPISKLILIPAYLVFGIHEWVGRVIQLLFFFGGAFYLYQLTLLFASRHAARLTAIVYLLLPPLFHYGNTHLIEGGSLFFICAAFFYWIRYWEKRSASDLITGSWMAVMGCLYKHTNVMVIPAFAVMWLISLMQNRSRKSWKTYGMEILANTLPAVTFMIYMKLSAFSSDVPSQMFFPTPARMWENIMAIPQGVTYPVFLWFVVSSCFIILIRHPFLPYWISWVPPHFFLTVMSMAFMNVRQALPYYLGILMGSALFADWLLRGIPVWRGILFYGILPVYFIGVCLWMPYEHQPEEWGRAMGDRSYINFTNWDESYVPYHVIVPALIEKTSPGDAVFAPMGNEPSRFYLAKHHGSDLLYERQIFTDEGEVVLQSLSTLKSACLSRPYNRLLLPRGKWVLQYADPAVIEPLFVHPPDWLSLEETFRYGRVEVGLWKIHPSSLD